MSSIFEGKSINFVHYEDRIDTGTVPAIIGVTGSVILICHPLKAREFKETMDEVNRSSFCTNHEERMDYLRYILMEKGW